jgi:hypothetical protein
VEPTWPRNGLHEASQKRHNAGSVRVRELRVTVDGGLALCTSLESMDGSFRAATDLGLIGDAPATAR